MLEKAPCNEGFQLFRFEVIGEPEPQEFKAIAASADMKFPTIPI